MILPFQSSCSVSNDLGQWNSRGVTPHMKGVGMLVRNFELTPKGDRSGHGPSFFWPLKKTTLKHRQMRKLGLYEWSKQKALKMHISKYMYFYVFFAYNPK